MTRELRLAWAALILAAFAWLLTADVAPADLATTCALEGNATKPEVRALNLRKNRSDEPADDEIDPNVTVEAMLQPGNDRNRWVEGTAVELVGWVYAVKVGGVETANCKATSPAERDTHIELTPSDMDTRPVDRVIVEITPRLRPFLGGEADDWATSAIRKNYVRRRVRVRGWLLFDAEHQGQSENTNPGGHANWRGTAWEVHPITSMEAVQEALQ